MGVKHATYLHGTQVMGCARCRAHLTTHAEVISPGFTGVHGDALLMGTVVNVTPGTPVERTMRTGKYTVQDVACSRCGLYLGWYYLRAFQREENYKQDKYVMEKTMMTEVR